MDNRYGDPAYDSLIEDLKSRLKDLRRELGEIDERYPELERNIEHNWNNLIWTVSVKSPCCS